MRVSAEAGAAPGQPWQTAQPAWSEPDGARPRLLAVDDEPYVLEGLKDTLRRNFNVATTTESSDALELLRQEPGGYAVVIADMRMPGMSGAEFLREARMVAPYTVRMLLTGNSGLETAIKAASGARLFRYLTKPCEPGELLRACAAAVEQHRAQTNERVFLDGTVRAMVEVLSDALAITSPAAYGRSGRLKTLAAPLARSMELPNAWEVEVAALLACAGNVVVPPATCERVYQGHELGAEEAAIVQRAPAAVRRMLSRVPRLEGVLEILDRYESALPEGAEGYSCPAPAGALVLRVAADFDQLLGEGANREVALNTMRRRGIYERQLLDGLEALTAGPRTVRELPLAELRPGMRLAADVWSSGIGLLAAREQVVSEELLERLRHYTAGTVPEPLQVLDGQG